MERDDRGARPHHDQAAAAWSQRHGGMDPSGSAWVSGWVRLTAACAGPLARWDVSPDVVTVAGVVLSATVPLLVAAGGGWPVAAVVVIVVAAVLDGVDGALASLTNSTSRWGAVIDPLADRCSDLLLILAMVVAGAPVWLGVALGVLTLLLESVRASAQLVGVPTPVVVTVWERPSRVIVGAFTIAGATAASLLVRPQDPSWADPVTVATVGTVIGVVLGMVGLLTLLRAAHRSTRP